MPYSMVSSRPANASRNPHRLFLRRVVGLEARRPAVLAAAAGARIYSFSLASSLLPKSAWSLLTLRALSAGTGRRWQLILGGRLVAGWRIDQYMATWKKRRQRPTALESRLLAARAGSLLGAYALALVTSAADHLGSVVWVWVDMRRS
jgi:hypothetical protein